MAAGREQKQGEREPPKRAQWTMEQALQLIKAYKDSGINKDKLVTNLQKGHQYKLLTDAFNGDAGTTFTVEQVKEKMRALDKYYRSVNASREQTGGDPDDRVDDDLYLALRDMKEEAGEMMDQRPLLDSLRPPLQRIDSNAQHGQASVSAAAASGDDREHPLAFDCDGESAAALPDTDSAAVDDVSVLSSSSGSSGGKRKKKEVPQQKKRQRRPTQHEQFALWAAQMEKQAAERARVKAVSEEKKLSMLQRLIAGDAGRQQQLSPPPFPSPPLSSSQSIFSSPSPPLTPARALASVPPSLSLSLSPLSSSSSSSSSSSAYLASRFDNLTVSREQRYGRAGADPQ